MNEIDKPEKCSEHECNNKVYAKDKITKDQWRWVCKKHHFQYAYGIDYPRETVRGKVKPMNLKDKYKILYEAFELILCPYCGARLNRVIRGGERILPTSCDICNKHNIAVKTLLVCEVSKNDSTKD